MNLFDSLYLTPGGHIDVGVYSENLDTEEPDGYLRIIRREDGRVVSSWQPNPPEEIGPWTIWAAQLAQKLSNDLRDQIVVITNADSDDG